MLSLMGETVLVGGLVASANYLVGDRIDRKNNFQVFALGAATYLLADLSGLKGWFCDNHAARVNIPDEERRFSTRTIPLPYPLPSQPPKAAPIRTYGGLNTGSQRMRLE